MTQPVISTENFNKLIELLSDLINTKPVEYCGKLGYLKSYPWDDIVELQKRAIKFLADIGVT